MEDKVIQKIVKRVIILGGIIIFFLLFFNNRKENILGYIFGSLISVASFFLMKQSVERSVWMTPENAKKYAMGQYFLRMIIYGVVLIVGAKADYLSFLTVVLGLISIKLVIVLSTIFDKGFLK